MQHLFTSQSGIKFDRIESGEEQEGKAKVRGEGLDNEIGLGRGKEKKNEDRKWKWLAFHGQTSQRPSL